MNVIKKFIDLVKNIFIKQETKKLEESAPINQEKIYSKNATPINREKIYSKNITSINQEKIKKIEPTNQEKTILKNKIKIPICVGDGLGIKNGFKS